MLYKIRDFGGVLNESFELIRKGKVLFISLLIYSFPFTVFGVVMLGEANIFFYSFSEKIDSLKSIIGAIILLFSLLNMMIIVYAYLKSLEKYGYERVSIHDVEKYLIKYFLPSLVVAIMAGILIIVGFIFFIIPGIYFSVVMYYALPSLIIGEKGILDSIFYSFKIIKNKWWFSFGLVFVAGLLMGIAQGAFTVLFAIFSGIASFTENEILGNFSKYFSYFSYSLAFFIRFYTFLIIGIMYFSLVEEKENYSFEKEIMSIDDENVTPPPPPDLDNNNKDTFNDDYDFLRSLNKE